MAASVTSEPWVERLLNPFLLRELRRQQRRRTSSFAGPLVLCALTVLGFVAIVGGLAVLQLTNRQLGEAGLLPTDLLAAAAQMLGTWLVGGVAWLTIFLGYWLATGQTWQEERQATIELLLASPISRPAMVWLLLGWPLLNILLYTLPLLPLLALLLPFLGLSFGGALGLTLIFVVVALLAMVRAPSGAGQRARRASARTGLQVALWGFVALWAIPLVGWLARVYLGLEGLGLVRWPLALHALMVEPHRFFGGEAVLGGWLLLVYALALLQRWLAALRRLAEGTEQQPWPAEAAELPLLVLLLWLGCGLWWGRGTASDPAVRLWFGLHLLGACYLPWRYGWPEGRQWLVLWAVGPRCRSPLALAAARLIDVLATALWPALVWRLAVGRTGGAAVPSWQPLLNLLALAACVAAAESWLRVRQSDGTASGGRLLRLVTLALWLAALLPGCYGLRSAVGPTGWTAAFLAWPAPLGAVLLGGGGLAALGRAWQTQRQLARRQECGPAPLLWRWTPPRWRENPLVWRAVLVMQRRGLTRAWSQAVLLLGLLGTVAGLLAPGLLAAGGRGPGGTVGWALAGAAELLGNLGLRFLTGWGVSGGAAVWLGLILAALTVATPCLVASAATLVGSVVTDERQAGSLGLLLLSDLRDAEVSEGFLVGQLYPLLEALLLLDVVVVLWAALAFHPLVWVVSAVLLLATNGALLLAGGLALLGTARYRGRANGAPLAMLAVVGPPLAAGLVLLMVQKVAAGFAVKLPAGTHLTVLATGAMLAAVAGVAVWTSGSGAIARLRRVGQLWRAFEAAGSVDQ
ncbi:MAG: hypothetical protein IT204_14420 [Fimbriimonadaceae bacterium]|nr:hypothetical protein [Fimbriimonadaceae bacterium]